MKALFSFLLGICLAAPAYAQMQDHKELRIGLAQEFDTLNQLITSMLASQYIYYATNRTLLALDTKGRWVPHLAEKIPTLENGGAKIITESGKKKILAVWEIKEQGKWSDGKPVVCADFQLSLEVANSPNVSIAAKDDYALVEKITWDEKTPKKCNFTYTEARWDYYQIGRFAPLPNHLERPIFEKYKNQAQGYDKNSLYSKDPAHNGLANGPYKILEVKPGSHVILIKNASFYGKPANFEKVVIRIIPNTGTLEANLQTGSIQVIGPIGFSLDQALDIDQRAKQQNQSYEVIYKPSLTYEHIDLDLDEPVLKDINVRKALMYGLDREQMVKSIFEGKQEVAHHNIAPTDPWYPKSNTGITIYSYNRRKAQKLLDSAGWKLNKNDGYRYKDGKKLSIRLMTTAGNKSRETVQTYLQSQWKDIGVEITIKNEPARALLGETMKKRTHDGMAMFAWIVFPERNQRPFLHSSSIPSEKNGWSGRNSVGWSNPKVDALIEKTEVEFDPKKRAQYAHEILKYYTDEIPVIPLFYRTDVGVKPKQLKGLELSGHVYSETNEIENWE